MTRYRVFGVFAVSLVLAAAVVATSGASTTNQTTLKQAVKDEVAVYNGFKEFSLAAAKLNASATLAQHQAVVALLGSALKGFQGELRTQPWPSSAQRRPAPGRRRDDAIRRRNGVGRTTVERPSGVELVIQGRGGPAIVVGRPRCRESRFGAASFHGRRYCRWVVPSRRRHGRRGERCVSSRDSWTEAFGFVAHREGSRRTLPATSAP